MDPAGAGPTICADVAKIIFEFLAPGREPDSTKTTFSTAEAQRYMCRRTLASAARTCRAWSDHALDVLWRVVDDPIHLLSLFPSFSLHRVDGITYGFTRLISDDEWARFQPYACRVRILDLPVGGFGRIHSSVWNVLSYRCRHEPLLPSLHSIMGFETSSSASGGLSELDMLRTPTLRYLQLDTQGGTGCIPYWELEQLRAIDVTHEVVATANVIEPLMKLPRLLKLGLVLEYTKLEPEKLSGTFAMLRDLALQGSIPDICSFVEALPGSFPRLQSVSLAGPYISQSDWRQPGEGGFLEQQLERLYTALEGFAIHDFLFTMGDHTMDNTYYSSSFELKRLDDLLTPVHYETWSSLRTLTFSFNFQGMFPYISDADLGDFVHACPELVSFELIYHRELVEALHEPGGRSWARIRGGSEAADAPTLSTIIAFTTAHPHLERLSLPFFSLKSIPALVNVPAGHRLKSFDIVHLERGPSIYPAALVLDRAFPNLALCEEPEADYSRRREQLRLLLLGMQAGRLGTHRHL
ncbi:hypothetical protein C8Q80DRAFT_1151990 [Daedaleopsis nitida]|nr:hypothetical protein C8Q80DRAFT_1151990 [Daedaleopsis nitida]